ncbi:MAG: phage integrase N-terminal SAM-like domain-containing protein [Pirellulaceae bacterium]
MAHSLSNPTPMPGDPTDPDGLSVLLDRHLLWMETHHYAWGTVTLRRQTLTRFIRWCHDRSVTRPGEVTRELLERYQRHLFFYRKRDGQPLSLSSQSHALIALRRLFSWLSRERLIARNPAAELQLPRADRRLPRHALSMAAGPPTIWELPLEQDWSAPVGRSLERKTLTIWGRLAGRWRRSSRSRTSPRRWGCGTGPCSRHSTPAGYGAARCWRCTATMSTGNAAWC